MGAQQTRVMRPVVGDKGTVLGTQTVPTFWALFSAHLRRTIELPNILPIFSGQKAGHDFVQVLVCLSSAPGFVFLLPCPQAPAVWGWSNWLAAEATRAGKELLLLNLDETPIPQPFPHIRGNVTRLDPAQDWLRAPRQRSGALGPAPPVALATDPSAVLLLLQLLLLLSLSPLTLPLLLLFPCDGMSTCLQHEEICT